MVPYPLSYYLNLIPSQHNQKPKFMAVVAASVQPFVDLQQTMFEMIGIFNPYTAVGDQLDKAGVWVGASRNLTAPLEGVYFTWGEDSLGWGEGTWLGSEDSTAGLLTLPDDSFSILVKLIIATNQWDGTVPGAYAIWNAVFGDAFGILIQDNQDMTMLVVFTGLIESVVTKTLIVGGYWNLRPAGVRITSFSKPSIPETPVFGWGVENSVISGWGTGCWIEPLL